MADRAMRVRRYVRALDVATTRILDVGTDFVRADPVDGEPYFRSAGYAAGQLVEAKCALWDLEPDLVPAASLPKLEVDLSNAVRMLDHPDPMIRENVIGFFLSYAPRDVVAEVEATSSEAERRRRLAAWWASVEQPFVPLDHLDRQLDARRRFLRIHAARALARLGVGDLIDPESGDVSAEAVARWRAERHRD